MSEVPSAHSIGLCAGQIWNYLSQHGKSSLIQLKMELSCTASVLHLALGWLSREGKIEFSKENGQLFVELKR